MPKRSEKRDTAKAAYIARKAAGEEVSLRELAQEQGVSYQTLRNWKAADRWDEALPKKRRGEVHRTADIERGIQSMFLNIRSRFLALPAKLSPTLSTMGGNQTGIFDELKGAIEEILEEMSDYRVAFAAEDGEDDGEAEKETPM